jgi:hypothetical protein
MSLPAHTARADIFGADIAVLGEILRNSVQQLYQLMTLVRTTRDNLDLVRDINQGLDDSLAMVRTMRAGPVRGLYSDWGPPAQAQQRLAAVYGSIPGSKASTVQRELDRGVLQGISIRNSAFDRAAQLDIIAEEIKDASHRVSPGGAAKLTAQGLGVAIHVMDESLRTQSTSLELQAQAIAAANHKDKEDTKHRQDSTRALKGLMQATSPTFATPRF